MRSSRDRFLYSTAFFSLLSFPAFGGPPRSSTGAELGTEIPVDRLSCGIGEVDGRVVGGGPDYRIEFDPTGFAVSAPFGSSAPRTWPLHLSLESVGREGAASIASVPSVLPKVEGPIAEWDLGTVRSCVEARVDGVEQSFVFASKPAGSGDLVVRQHVTTDLVRAMTKSGAPLRFEAAGFGAITIGDVTGIDARGQQAAGSLTFDGSTLEYRLPAEFVERAAYPLVLDPLVGSDITVASGFDEKSPDVTFDESTGRYLVVWSRQFASGDYDIRGQILDGIGNPVLGLLPIDIDATVNALNPRVGNMNNSSKALVAWVDASGFLNGTIQCRGVSMVSGGMSPKLPVGPSSGFNAFPDVAGESQENQDTAAIVWESFDSASGELRIMGARVNVPVSGNPVVAPAVTLTSGFNDTEPAISSHDLFGVRMIVWKRDFTSGDSEIRGMTVDRFLNIGDSFIAVTNDSLWESHPAVDGDGYNFLVAFESEATNGSGDRDIRAVRVRADASGQDEPDATTISVDVGVLDSNGPDVAWMYGSALVSWQSELLDGTFRAKVVSLDPLSATTCENYFDLPIPTPTAGVMHLGSAHNDLAMTVREVPQPATGGQTMIVAHRFSAADGGFSYLSGPCGALAYASCAKIGHSSFGIHMTAAPAGSATFLIVGTGTISVPCGLCALVVNPTNGLFLSTGNADANGEASLVAGIPNSASLSGLKFDAQFLVVSPGVGAACTPAHSILSNGIEVTLQ